MQSSAQKQARVVRFYRWIHRKLALAFFIFFLIITVTGILLGVKKQTGLLAPTAKGQSADLNTWIPTDSLEKLARKYLHDSVSPSLSTALDRIDIRPAKGIAKFVYEDHYWGLQLDCTTGELLSVEKRNSDLIEAIHDGSIVDRLTGTGNDSFKVSYMVILGLSLLLMILSGFWLWYGPRKIRNTKRRKTEEQ